MSKEILEHIKTILAVIPEKPGCYQYFDEKGTIIYVGKAKNLKRIFSLLHFSVFLVFGSGIGKPVRFAIHYYNTAGGSMARIRTRFKNTIIVPGDSVNGGGRLCCADSRL